MQIKRIEIFNRDQQLIQFVDFKLNRLNIIYGDTNKPEVKGLSSNSVGKTTLIKIIDFIYRNAHDDKVIKPSIHGYKVKALIIHNNEESEIVRFLGDTNTIYLNGEKITTDAFQKSFGLDNNSASRLSIIKPYEDFFEPYRGSIKSSLSKIIRLLNFQKIVDVNQRINTVQENIDHNETSRKQTLKLLNISPKDFDKVFFDNNKEIQSLEEELNQLTKHISDLSISSNTSLVQKDYENHNQLVKNNRLIISSLLSEKQRYLSFQKEMNSHKFEFNAVKEMYMKAKIEFPDSILVELSDVERFYQSVYDDRNEAIINRIKDIDKNLSILEQENKKLSDQLDHLAMILSEDNAYKIAISLVNDKNKKLQIGRFRSGQLKTIKMITDELEQLKIIKVQEQAELNREFIIYSSIIESYKQFIFESIDRLYKDKSVSFNIKTSNPKQKYPITIDFKIDSEGINGGIYGTKLVLFHYLLFKANHIFEHMIIDSSSYDPIDPRQVGTLILILSDICNQEKKQAFLAISKYQIDEEMVPQINDFISLTLDEDNRLLKLNFE